MKHKIVLDTNVLLVSISRRSSYRIIFDALLDNKYGLILSTEILVEYEEIIGNRYDVLTVNNMFEVFLTLKNVQRQEIYYDWNLIQSDQDDNKFVNVAIASNVSYLVTNDKHFNVLKNIVFPKVALLSADEFIEILKPLY